VMFTHMTIDLIIRLAVAGLLGAGIGLEREFRSKEAGLRTHFLVAVGSALIMLVSKYGFSDIIQKHNIVLDPSRVAAQVVSGIGFLGAGTIIINKQFVKGLTTAAGIWATSGIGLCVGAGMYIIGTCAAILVLIGLEILSRIFKSKLQHPVTIELELDRNDTIEAIFAALKANHVEISLYDFKENLIDDHQIFTYKIKGKIKTEWQATQLYSSLHSIPHIKAIKIE